MKSELNGIVRGATYYFDEEKVSLILFHLEGREKAGSSIVRKHFLTTFGEPDGTRRKDMFWKATDREWVVVKAEGEYTGTYTVHVSNSKAMLIEFGLKKPNAR